MSKLTPVFAVTTIGAVIATVYLSQQLNHERQRSASLQDRVTELELAQARQPASGTPPAAVLPGAAPAAAIAATQPTTPTAAAATPAPAAAGAPASVQINSTDLMKDPDFRASVEASLRQSIGQLYPDLAKELELSPEQSRKLLDLIASNTMSGMKMSTNAQGATSVSTSGGEDMKARRDEQIRTLLGDSKLQQWKSYEQTLPARMQMVRLRTTLESTGGNLSQPQQQQLIATLAEEQKRQAAESARMAQIGNAPRNGPEAMEQMLQRTESSNQRILDASLSYLSPQQQEALRAQQNMELGSTRAMLRAQRARADAPQTQAVPGGN